MIEELPPSPDLPATAPGPPPVPATAARPPLAPPGPATEAPLAPLPVKPNTWPTAFAGVLRSRAVPCAFVSPNPKRARGNCPKAVAAYDKYMSATTVAEFFDSGGNKGHLWYDLQLKYCTLDAAALAAAWREYTQSPEAAAPARAPRVVPRTSPPPRARRPAPKKKAASAPAKRPPAKKRRTTPTPTPRKPKPVPAPRPPDECWCIGEGADIAVRRATIDGQEVVHICDSYGPGITVSDDQLLDDETCRDLRERILNASDDPDVVRYAGRRSFVPAEMGDAVARLVRSPGWGRVERALVAPLYRDDKFELVSACGFVVEPGTKKQPPHTDIDLEKDLDRADRAVVAVHIPLDETSELLGGTQWLVKRRKDPLATVWGRRGRPYALNAALWHGGSGNRTTERRAVLALRFLPTDLPSRARDSFDDHFPGLRWTLPAE